MCAHADAAFARTLGDLGLDPEKVLTDMELGIVLVFDHLLEERLLSGNITTEPTAVENYK